MLINELSKVTGLTVHTLRYYENLGLIEGQKNETIKSNNYKNYDDEVVEKIKIIKDVQGIGFTLAEIKKMFNDCYGGTITDEDRIEIFNDKIKEVEAKVQHFKAIKSRLISIRKNIESNLGCKE